MSDHVNGREQVLGTRKEKAMPLNEKDYDRGMELYRGIEDAITDAQRMAAAAHSELYDRLHGLDVNLVAHELDAILTPLSDAYALMGQAQKLIYESHKAAGMRAFKSKIIPGVEGGPPAPRSGGVPKEGACG